MEPNKELDKLAHAAIEVHRHLGPGYLEQVYEDALAVELSDRGIRFQRQGEIAINYKGRQIGTNRLDLLIDGKLIVELKAVNSLAPLHKAQVISYLKATSLSLALLINFNVPVLKYGISRIVLT